MASAVSAVATVIGTIFGIRSAKKARRAAARQQAAAMAEQKKLADEKQAIIRRRAFEAKKKAEREQKMKISMRGRGRRGLLSYIEDTGPQL